ncbi:MAG: hypothetical protein ABFR53_03190 [Actinomycetota bacterium]
MNVRKLSLAVVLLALGGLLALPVTATAVDPPERPDIDLHAKTLAVTQSQGGEHRAPLEQNLSQIGFVELPSFQTSDVWALGDFAYVGGFGPGTTVKVVDISDPTDPQVVEELGAPDGCSPQDVKAERINTKAFQGDLLVVGNDGCDEGLQLYDVTDPTNPLLLSEGGPGHVHNTYLYQKGSRAYVLAAVPFAEVFDGFGDFVVMDITDPTNPAQVADWGAGKDGGIAFGSPFFAGDPSLPAGSDCTPPPGTPELCRGDSFPGVLLHDVWASTDGNTAYLSYWDAGLILLDISEPTDPTLLGRGDEPPTFGNDEGNAHVAVPARGGNLVLVGDEDFAPGPWGFLRVFDTSDTSNPYEIGAFATPGSLGSDPDPATMHNIVVQGNRAYLSWYFEGIRVVDFSQPTAPREVAAFIPDSADTSDGFFWGVYVHEGLVLASDLSGGLFVLSLDGSG